MSDRFFAFVVQQNSITQVQLQVLTVISAQVAYVIGTQVGVAAQNDDDFLDV